MTTATETAATPFLLPGTEGERPFDASSIEREFRAMWKSAAPSRGALYRAALANVIVPLDPVCHAPLDPVLTELTRRHPSRLFRLERRAEAPGAVPGSLVARASALCHRRPGNGGIVCSEQIVLGTDPSTESLASSAIASLLVGDIPVILLHVGGDACAGWPGLEEMADVILEDSAAHDNAATMAAVWKRIATLGSARARDIAWTRLTPWRGLIAEVFDQPGAVERLPSVRDVTIRHGGATPSAGAWLMAGWLASRLGWTLRSRRASAYRFATDGKEATVTFKREPDVQEKVVTSVRLRAGKSHPLDVVVTHRHRAPAATIEFVTPASPALDRTFAYREFAPCLVGEIHRHGPNEALDQAASVAVALVEMAPA